MAMSAVAMAANNTTLPDPMGGIFDMTAGQKLWHSFRLMFYLFSPSDSMFERVNHVPSYMMQVIMFLPIYFALEMVVMYIQGLKMPRWNDAIASVATFCLLFIPVAVVGNFELKMYEYLWDNYRIISPPWDSRWTWWIGLFVTDFGQYCWHRFAHEVNFVWAFHQVHHSPEEYSLLTAIRVAFFNRQMALVFYLPGALIIPPSIFYVHYQLGYIYQVWIHTPTIPCLGPIEYIFNTPSLHRVHHGRNRYCIDKNYGGFLSLWDVLFGTWERERPDVKISYGLVSPIRSWDLVYIQSHHMRRIFKNVAEYDGISNKLSAIFKGPGWAPGKPRLGYYEEIPEFPEEDLYDKQAPQWVYYYCASQLVLFFLWFAKLSHIAQLFPASVACGAAGFLMMGMINIGYFLENKSFAPFLETLRCISYFVLEYHLFPYMAGFPYQRAIFRCAYLFGAFLWYNNSDVYKEKPGKKMEKVE